MASSSGAGPRPATMEFREPKPRHYHATVAVDNNMLMWGGYGVRETSTVETFDVLSATWREPRQLHGDTLPDGLYDMAVTSDKKRAYVFGGHSDSPYKFYNQLFVIDVTSLECKELIPGSSSRPSGREGSRMVYYERKLVIYGGGTDRGVSDELHTFDLDTETWTIQTTTGEKPPPLTGHTLTMTDGHRATVFGGSDGGRRHNDTYVLDMKTWPWTKLKTSEKKPPPRYDHAACSIEAPNTQLLMVVGGRGGVETVFSDVWLLDLTSGRWSEVALPSPITPRVGHSCEVFGCGPDFGIVVLFGGRTYGATISKTTLLLLSVREGSWKVDRVVGPADLVAPDDSLREQMMRLQLSPPTADYL